MINQPIHRSKLLLFFAFLMFVIFNVFCYCIIKNHIIISATYAEDDETVIKLTNLMNNPATNQEMKDKCESLISEIKDIKPKIIHQINIFYNDIIESSLNDSKYTKVSSNINEHLSSEDLSSSDSELLTEMSQFIKIIIDNNQNIKGLLNQLLNATKIQDMITIYDRLKTFLDNNKNSLNKIEDINYKLSVHSRILSSDLEILRSDIEYICIKSAPADYENVDTLILSVLQGIKKSVAEVLPNSNSDSTNLTEKSQKQTTTWWWFLIVMFLLVFFVFIFFHHKKKKKHHNPYYFEKNKF
ncbi:hypothetical protein C6B37_00825 [Candidatus Phytoplasma phoenicium]|uniref:Uncharacterized protein n=1 Tax=Candidatus Phytoplasma phoenicium TaxID=198422 RepID=A0A2S8NV73_9MOLU|nr:hypothetical protein C6B37_00825 [Candidatus Phytoplasma phoenicium]